MKKWKLVTGVLLIFVLGVLAGSLGTEFYHHYFFERVKKDPGDRKAFILKKFSERLHLTEEQQKAFKPIIDQMDRQIQMQILNNRSEFKKIRDESAAQMKKILNPDQQHVFDELIKEIRERRKDKILPDRPDKKNGSSPS